MNLVETTENSGSCGSACSERISEQQNTVRFRKEAADLKKNKVVFFCSRKGVVSNNITAGNNRTKQRVTTERFFSGILGILRESAFQSSS